MGIAFIISLLVAVVLLSWLGPDIEDNLFPIYTGIKSALVDKDPNSIDIITTGTKQRSCLLLAVQAEVKVGDRWVAGTAKLLRENGEPLRIEDQRVAVGSNFVRLVKIQPMGSAVKIKIEAKCHPFWITTQNYLQMDINNAP